MQNETNTCPNCQTEFEPEHGNQVFCSYRCYDKYKRKKQRENGSLLKQFRRGFLANYKLFRRLLAEAGTFKISLLQLLKDGFDQNAYYGIVRDKEKKEWCQLNEYYFRVDNINQQPYLFIYKE